MTLRPSQLATLRAIADLSPYNATVVAVARSLDISTQAAEGRIERLAAAEFVDDMQIRWPYSQSGWITLAVLTKKGAACMGAVGG